MTKKIFALVMVISVLGAFTVGCSKGDDPATPAASTTGTATGTTPAATTGTTPAATAGDAATTGK